MAREQAGERRHIVILPATGAPRRWAFGIQAMSLAVWVRDCWQRPVFAEDLEQATDAPRLVALVAERPVGYLSLTSQAASWLISHLLVNVSVDGSPGGFAIREDLVVAAQRRFRRDLVVVVRDHQVSAKRLYGRLGFEIERTTREEGPSGNRRLYMMRLAYRQAA